MRIVTALTLALCIFATVSPRPEGARASSPVLQSSLDAYLLFPLSQQRSPAQEIVTQVPDAEYSFGQHITFHLEARSEAAITEVNLFFRVQGQTDTTAVAVPFEPGTHISVSHPHSLVGHSVPPFVLIDYWWEIQDASSRRQESETKQLYYADNRYEWDYIVDPREDIRLIAYWVQGDVSFGQAALNIANKALVEISRDLQTPVPGDIQIYIYPSEQDLRSALNLGGYDWAGGQARPELGAILVGIPNSLSAPGEMERLIPHELTHLLVYLATGQTLGRVPSWLNEGLASIYERRPDPAQQGLVERALAQDQLFPLEALCGPFPTDENAVRLAYAQSASVVRYLRDTYGNAKLRQLLAAYADNAGCDAGVNRALKTSLRGLDAAWRAHLTRQGQVMVALQDSAVWLGLGVLTILLVLPFLGVLGPGRREKFEGGEV